MSWPIVASNWPWQFHRSLAQASGSQWRGLGLRQVIVFVE